MDEQVLYRGRAELYYRIYHWKDYESEAARVRQLLRGADVRDGARVVEAACGTGAYLAALARWYDVAGFDLSEGMLAVARAKLPGVQLWHADMADVAGAEREPPADAVVCLFSSIGYMHGQDRLASAARAFHAALRPGGAVLVEPWLTPATVEPGHPSVQTYDSDDLKVVRACVARVEGRVSILDFHWLVVRRNEGVEHFTERHALWLATREELIAAFEAAGFTVRWEDDGLMPGRGMLVGRRPRGG